MVKKADEIKVKNPRNLIVYGKCMELNKMVYECVKKFPKIEQYMMVSQVLRCCTSIGANLAEGNSQIYINKEINFYNNSIGSANELIYWMDNALQNNYLGKEQYANINELIEEILRILITMVKKLKNKEGNFAPI